MKEEMGFFMVMGGVGLLRFPPGQSDPNRPHPAIAVPVELAVAAAWLWLGILLIAR